MCGIACILGAGADPRVFARMLTAIAPRGEVQETLCEEGRLLGVQRLKIVDRQRAIQPWTSADGRTALCYNGEIYNFRALRSELEGLGHSFRSDSDTEVVLEAYREWGRDAVLRLRGEFAFAVVDRETSGVYLARDPVGVKPLYWAAQGGQLLVGSEVKALVPAAAKIHEVAPGHHGHGSPGRPPQLAPYVDLLSLGDDDLPVDDVEEAAQLVRKTLRDSIRVRVDTDLTVGVVLSGGLDSTLTLLHVHEVHPDCVAFTIGASESQDIEYSRRLTRDLGVPHEVIELSPRDIRLANVRKAIRVTELTEYGDLINAAISVPLFARVHECGVKVVLCGDGSDEVFAGYEMYRHSDGDMSRRTFQHMIRNLSRTELQRVDRASMGQGVETRVPFLDLSLVRLAMRLPIGLKLRDGQEKWILRHAFADLLPDYVRSRPKNPLSHSSGLHERVRLYRPLFAPLYRSFGYERLEPMRRDFSIVLERHQMDLDRALASEASRTDYTALEHGRDLLGAVRWNATAATRRLVRTVAGAGSTR